MLYSLTYHKEVHHTLLLMSWKPSILNAPRSNPETKGIQRSSTCNSADVDNMNKQVKLLLFVMLTPVLAV